MIPSLSMMMSVAVDAAAAVYVVVVVKTCDVDNGSLMIVMSIDNVLWQVLIEIMELIDPPIFPVSTGVKMSDVLDS